MISSNIVILRPIFEENGIDPSNRFEFIRYKIKDKAIGTAQVRKGQTAKDPRKYRKVSLTLTGSGGR